MKKHFAYLLLPLFLLTSCSKEEVDLIVHNATIYQVNEEFTKAEAMAIRGEEIIAIGAEHEIMNKYTSKSILDAGKRFIYPGLIDAHCHYYGYGLSLQTVNLVGTSSFEDVISRLAKNREKVVMGWITGRGWDQNDWENKEFPDRKMIDSLFPSTPVFLKRIDGHAAIANQAALDFAGITADMKVEGGTVVVKDGRLTGVLIDNAVDLIEQNVPKPDRNIQIKALIDAQEQCFMVGLTTVDDAGLEKEVIDLIDTLQHRGELKMKVYAMATPTEENLQYYLTKGPYQTDLLNVRSFKVYADGALGSSGARLLHPYSDAHDQHAGWLIHSAEYYSEIAAKCYDKGFQMNTHAIGDSANRLILNTYASILKGTNDRRWRIEHAQVIAAGDFELFGKNNILPSVQPTHATSDMYWSETRLGPERIKGAYAYKKLKDQNGIILLGTDFPVEDISPVKTFYAAVVRKDSAGYPERGFRKENALSREEALKGMTIWAAIGNFEETSKGSLEEGKKADFILTDRDIMTVDESHIPGTAILATFINGKMVYKAKMNTR